MNEGWREVEIGEFAKLQGGYAFKSEEFKEKGISVVKIKNIQGITATLKDSQCFSEEDITDKLEKFKLRNRDILIAMTGAGSVGRVGRLVCSEAEYGLLNQRVGRFDVDSNNLNREFLYYVLIQPKFQEALFMAGSGSGQPNLSPSQIESFYLPLPPLPEQKAIAHILGKLDDKIELNRQMNQTLEDMAQALFQSWFVDFDPVHAKAALKHSTLEGESENQGRSPQMIRWGEESENQGRSPQMLRWGEIKRQYTQQAQTYSKALRQNLTNAERLLWHYLRNKQLDGYKFRRQQAMGNYIVDFVCLSKKIIIELDGGQHQEQQIYDLQRDNFLQQQGYKVLRFWNNDVFNNCFGVLEKIYAELVGTNSPLEGVFDFRQKTLTILFFFSNINSILPFKIVY